jgi:chorismate mutase
MPRPSASALAAVRGATTAAANSSPAIRAAVTDLMTRILAANRLEPRDLVAAFFTATRDLDAAFPAEAARALGLSAVPLLCAQEIPVKGAPRRCLRVLLLAKARRPMKPVYLKGARRLRSDLTGNAP